MDNIITCGKVAVAILGGILGRLIGEINGMMIALLVFMAIDYITGVLIAIEGKTLSSEVGFKGLRRKLGTVIKSAAIAFYLANEGVSILENTTLLGVPYPDKLKDILIQLKDNNDGK